MALRFTPNSQGGNRLLSVVIGPTGETGATGTAATIAVGTVTDVANGQPATVTNSGTSAAAVFDFEIPTGPQGEQGIQGSAPDIRRNRIVNPCKQISQENGTSGATTDAYFPADQWYIKRSHAGTTTFARVASASPAGSPNRLRATVTAQDTSVAAGDYVAICQDLEGSRMADFLFGTANAKAGVIRLGLNAPAGTYCVSINNPAFDRSFLAEVVISGGEASTNVVKEVSFAGQTGGTWGTADTKGWTIAVCLMAGTDYQASAGWQTNSTRNRYGTSNQTNWMGNADATTFDLFDVGLKMDVDGIGQYGAFEVPDPVEELSRCKRYWQPLPPWIGQLTTTGTATIGGALPIRMRTTPTVALVSGTNAITEWLVAPRDISALGSSAIGTTGGYLDVSLGSAGTVQNGCAYNGGITLNARM